MDVYKDFIQRLTKKTFDDVYFLINGNICPMLKEFIVLLRNITFEDGAYHAYYGKIKKIVSSLCSYYSQSIDEIRVKSDKYRFGVTKQDLMALLEETANIYQINQIEYGRGFLPAMNSTEREMYDEMEVKFNEHMIKLRELGEKIEVLDKNKQDSIDKFGQEQANISIQRTSEVLAFTHGYIAMMLSEVPNKIRISLEEIHLRLHNNLLRIQEKNEEKINALMQELYEKNKKRTFLMCRQANQPLAEEAEISRSLEIIKEKLEDNSDYLRTKTRIEEELKYFKHRLEEFHGITKIINELKAQQEEVIKQEEDYNKIKSSESPGAKMSCCEELGEKICQRKEYLNEKISLATKMLVTFFSFRGTNRIFYTDHIGPYHVDEFNHQIYIFDYGLRIYHLNCEGEFIDVPEDTKYYFDENGRYIFENGEKIYQCASCASKYKLTDNTLLEKISQECGHSEESNLKCRMKIKELTDVEILPTTDILDIKNTLSPEVVKYLWDNFGQILPDALYDIGMSEPINPIHRLAHKILRKRYNKTADELRLKSEEAQAYKSAIYKERQIKAAKAAKAWKAKLVKPRKPEEFDNDQEFAVYEAHLAQEKYINLNFYQDPC